MQLSDFLFFVFGVLASYCFMVLSSRSSEARQAELDLSLEERDQRFERLFDVTLDAIRLEMRRPETAKNIDAERYYTSRSALEQFRRNDFRQAADYAANWIEICPHDDAKPYMIRAKSLLELRDEEGDSRAEEAYELLSKAIEISPDADLFFERARAQTSKWNVPDEQLASAIEDLTTAIDLEPARANLFFARAQVRKRKCDFENALKDFDSYLSYEPDCVHALYRRAHVLSALGRSKDANASLSNARRIDGTWRRQMGDVAGTAGGVIFLGGLAVLVAAVQLDWPILAAFSLVMMGLAYYCLLLAQRGVKAFTLTSEHSGSLNPVKMGSVSPTIYDFLWPWRPKRLP